MSEPAVDTVGSGLAPVIPQETAAPHLSKTDQIAQLLRGEGESPVEVPPETEPSTPTPAEKLDLKSVAERLGVDPAALYELEVTTGDGETLKLGALKDGYQAVKGLEKSREELAKERGTWQAEQIRTERELGDLLSALPRESITPELQQTVERITRERVSRETEALYRKVPEWSDANIRSADVRLMIDHLKPYGFTEGDLNAVLDHRLLAYFRDQAKLGAKLAKAKPEPAAPRVGQAPRRANETPAQEFGRLKAAVTKGQMSKTDAIGRLLRG